MMIISKPKIAESEPEIYERSIFLSDIHVPFHDKNSLNVVNKFTKWFEPKTIFLVGDIIDFYSISTFDKDPQRINNLQSDIDETHKVLSEIRKNSPKSEIIYLEGNHEIRLKRYLWKHPEIASLKALSFDNLLGLKELKIKYKPSQEICMFHKFYIEHGDLVRKHSGYTAHGQMEKRGISGLSGHSHRLSTHYLTNMGGNFVWAENGCLCSTSCDYIIGLPNWQQGFSIGYFKKGLQRFSLEQISIIHNKCVYAGKEFK